MTTKLSKNQTALVALVCAAAIGVAMSARIRTAQQETDRIRQERDEQLRRAELIIESEDRAIIMCDEAGVITVSNMAAEQLTGWSNKELVGQPSTVVIPERFRQSHTEHVAAAADRIRAFGGNSLLTRKEMEITILQRNGEERPALADIRVIKYGSLVESIISMRRVHTQRAPLNQIQRLPSVTVPPPEVESSN